MLKKNTYNNIFFLSITAMVFMIGFISFIPTASAERPIFGSNIINTSSGASCPGGYTLEYVDNPYQISGDTLIGAGNLYVCLSDLSYVSTPSSGVTATLTANPTSIISGQSSTLTWSSTNATSCSGIGFTAGGATSGSVSVSPNVTTTYSISCYGEEQAIRSGEDRGSGEGTGVSIRTETYTPVASDSATVEVGGVDLVPERPSLNSGSLADAGNIVTFVSIIRNAGGGDILGNFQNIFELDLGNDGTFDLIFDGSSLTGLNATESKTTVSPNWITVNGTHAIRVVVDNETSYSFSSEGFCVDSGIGNENALNPNGVADGPICIGGTSSNNSYEWVQIDSSFTKVCSGGRNSTNIQNRGANCSGGGSCTASQEGNTCKDTGYDDCLDVGTAYSSVITYECQNTGGGDSSVAPSSNAGQIAETDEENNISPTFVFTVGTPACSDGIDNDGDGFTDYPNDLGCAGSQGDSESAVNLQCSDGIDNDGDGDTDYPNDSDCAGTQDNSEAASLELTLTADRTLLQKTQSAELSWLATGTYQSCTLSGDNGDSWTLFGSSGTQTTSSIENTTVYTLSCIDESDSTVTAAVTLKLVPSFQEI